MLRSLLTGILFVAWMASSPTCAQEKLPVRFAWFVDFSPDGKSLVAPYGGWLPKERGEVRVWDVNTGKPRHVIASPRGVRGAAWSRNGKYFASSSYGGGVVLYDARTGKKKRELSTGGDNAELVQITPDGRLIIVATGRGMIWVWETESGKLTGSMPAHSDSIWGIRLAADGRTLATAGKDQTVRVTDIVAGKELFRFEHPGITNGVAFTSDGKQLVTGCWDRQIRVWDLDSGQLTRTLRGHQSSVNDLDFSPNDKFLASSSSDQTIRMWEFATGELLATFTGHTASTYGVRFSPDGKLIASGSWDATVRLWDVETRKELRTLVR